MLEEDPLTHLYYIRNQVEGWSCGIKRGDLVQWTYNYIKKNNRMVLREVDDQSRREERGHLLNFGKKRLLTIPARTRESFFFPPLLSWPFLSPAALSGLSGPLLRMLHNFNMITQFPVNSHLIVLHILKALSNTRD